MDGGSVIEEYEGLFKAIANNGLAIVLLVYLIYRGDQVIQSICAQNKAMNDLIAVELTEIKLILKEVKQALKLYGDHVVKNGNGKCNNDRN
jgi:glycine cleavage system pyridoxal-binding protein P